MEAGRTKKRYKLNLKKLIVLVLFLYLLGSGTYYVINRPIKNIIISGNNLVSDAEIIKAAGIEDYPSIIRTSSKDLEQNIKKINLITSIRIKKDYRFRLSIEVEEAKVILYNQNNNQVLLNTGRYIDNNKELMGIPTLINLAPENILKNFASKLGELDYEILSLISEIEYSQMQNIEGTILDDTRFLLYMNDGNQVYINVTNTANLERYIEIFAGLGNRKGIIYLDSIGHLFFSPFESLDDNDE